MRLRFTSWLFYLLIAAPAGAAELAPYGYPFDDPFEATVIGTPRQFRADLPEEIPVEIREVRVFTGRELPDIFWYTENLRYALSAQPRPAPLAFILPGTGANFDAAKSRILQQALYQAGFHVVSLPSPLHPNFIVSASASRRPGLLVEDAADLYRLMGLIRRSIADEIEITAWHLIGYSLGGTYAAFVARLDDELGAFGFEKVLLINPPVDLYRSARILDAMFEEHLPTLAEFDALFHQLMRVFSKFYSPTDQFLFSDDLVYQLYRRAPPPDRTLEALIGAAFRLSLINLLFTSDVLTHSGLLVAPERELSLTDSLTPYFKAASRLSFEDYATRILYPYYLRTFPDGSFEQLIETNSLHVVEDYLRNADKVGLIHNEDDFLLGDSDLEFLKDVFGDRAKIYLNGGHSGNMAYIDNAAYLIDFFTSRGGS